MSLGKCFCHYFNLIISGDVSTRNAETLQK